MKSTPAQHNSRCQYLPVRMSDGTEQLAVDCSADTSRALSGVLTRKGTRPLKMHSRCPTNVDSIVNSIKTKMNVSDLKTQSVPRSKHFVSVIKTNQLMLYREIIAVCSEIRTKHINAICGQNVEFVNVKAGGT